MWRQSCTCNLDARARQIQIGDGIVGIVGLDDALEQLCSLGRVPGPEAAEELLAAAKGRNYVPRGDEERYRAALLREYAAYWETKSGAGHAEERG